MYSVERGEGWEGWTYVKSWLKFISYPCLEQDAVAAPDEEDDVILVDVADDDDIIHTHTNKLPRWNTIFPILQISNHFCQNGKEFTSKLWKLPQML